METVTEAGLTFVGVKRVAGKATFVTLRGVDPEAAKAFLCHQTVDQELCYLAVETPGGTWGVDVRTIYLESLRPCAVAPRDADCAGTITAVVDGGDTLLQAARGDSDNFVVMVACGRCGREWLDGVAYRDLTVLRCPVCATTNRVDSYGITVTPQPFGATFDLTVPLRSSRQLLPPPAATRQNTISAGPRSVEEPSSVSGSDEPSRLPDITVGLSQDVLDADQVVTGAKVHTTSATAAQAASVQAPKPADPTSRGPGWFPTTFQRYGHFSGRAQRAEYWVFALVNTLVLAVLVLLGGIAAWLGGEVAPLSIAPLALYVLVLLVPSLAVSVRRLHDTNRSGWWLLLSLVPFGGLALLVLFALDGDTGPNAYGPNPKAPPRGQPAAQGSRWAWAVPAVAILLGVLIGVGLLPSRNTISTDNAQIDGDKINIDAPSTGTLVAWHGEQGTEVRTGQILGEFATSSDQTRPATPVRSPGNGTVAINNAVEGQWVTAGTQLATAYDFNKIYLKARVDNTQIGYVHLGAPVDIDINAYPGAQITGLVTEVQGADEFSLFPELSKSPSPSVDSGLTTVRITLVHTDGTPLVPGMSATVRIHKN